MSARGRLAAASAVVDKAGARRLRDGSPWVFRTSVLHPPSGPLDTPFVDVTDERGNPVARALWAPVGALALRRFGPPGSPVDDNELARRVQAALAMRTATLPGVESLRLIHGEADDLPGVFVDRYARALVVQSASSASEWLMPRVLRLLESALAPTLVVRRDDGSARDMESLPRVAEILFGGPSPIARYREGTVELEVDLLRGHKTGSYLDQRDNHVLSGTLAGGDCLDLFSNIGGFGLHMAKNARHVICVEQDEVTAAQLSANARINGLADRVDVRAENAFDVVRALDEEGRRFQTVVVDPPALAKRAGPLEGALRGYFELNRRALRLCDAGAWLMTFSCSARVSLDDLTEVVMQAASQSRRRAQVVMRRHAGPDHPGLLGMREAEYLKGLLLRVF